MSEKKSVKEVIIGTMENGPEVLNELSMARKSGASIETKRNEVKRKIAEYHPKELCLKVIEKEQLTALATRLRLATPGRSLPVFEAGQYLNIFVEIDGLRTSRPYSIATAPSERSYFDIIVARTEKGFVSDYLIDKLEVGAELQSSAPMGVFRYQPTHHKKHLVFLAGGSGITPMQSIIMDQVSKASDLRLTLFYGARSKALLTNHEFFRALASDHQNFTYVPVISDAVEDLEAGMEKGFLTADIIKKYVPETAEATYFICGPEVMNSFCEKELAGLGVRRAMIRRELFQSRKDIEHEAGWPSDLSPEQEFELTFEGKSFKAKANQSILESLERAGFAVHVGCRSGECSFCRLKLVKGRVFTARGCLLRKADEVFGYIHSCKTYPISDLELRY